MAESSTLQTREFNAGFVTMEYFGYLRRDPDTSGFNFWLTEAERLQWQLHPGRDGKGIHRVERGPSAVWNPIGRPTLSDYLRAKP